jgi:hypothetical protein
MTVLHGFSCQHFQSLYTVNGNCHTEQVQKAPVQENLAGHKQAIVNFVTDILHMF